MAQLMQITCANNHINQPVILILEDESKSLSERLLCQICLNQFGVEGKSLSFQNEIQKLIEKQEQVYKLIEPAINQTLEQIEHYKYNISQLKNKISGTLDNQIFKAEQWIKGLTDQKYQQKYVNPQDHLQYIGSPIKKLESWSLQEIYKMNEKHYKQMINLSKELFQQDELDKCEEQLIQIFRLECFKELQFDPYKGLTKAQRAQMHQFLNNKIIQRTQLQGSKTKQILEEQYQFEDYWYAQLMSTNRYLSQLKIEILQKINSLQLELKDQALKNWMFTEGIQEIFSEQISMEEKILKMRKKILTNESQQKDSFKDYISQIIINQFKILNQNQTQVLSIINDELKGIKIKERYFTRRESISGMFKIEFNMNGSLMAAGIFGDIHIYQFQKQNLQDPLILKGQQDYISSLVFSKKYNWLVVGSRNNTIRCWKEHTQKEWKNNVYIDVHKDEITGTILNNDENELISCSKDHTIAIWKVDYKENKLIYDYSIKKHTDSVFCICLNPSDDELVSCGNDKQIIIWDKKLKNKWELKQTILPTANDIGYKICYLSVNSIVWQQRKQGQTHIFELENGQFVEKHYKKYDNHQSFPTLCNLKEKIFIQKRGKQIYFYKLKKNGSLIQQLDSINCGSEIISAGLSNNGQYFVISDIKNQSVSAYELSFQ